MGLHLNTSIDELLEDENEKVSSLKQNALIPEATLVRVSAVKRNPMGGIS